MENMIIVFILSRYSYYREQR